MIGFENLFALIFLFLLGIFALLHRKKLETKHLIPYVLYFSLYKTTWGLKLMDSMSKKARKFWVYFGYAGIVIGFLGMALISFTLIQNLYVLFTKPAAAPGVGLVLPFKAKGIFFVPFFYWIISIFIIAIVHEFAHGLIARAHNLKVKSSGFAFLALIVPIIPAAFVEPDENKMKKRPHKEQLSIFAAGPFANILLAFLLIAFAALIMPFGANFVEPDGVKISNYAESIDGQKYPVELAGIKTGEIVYKIDNFETPYVDNLSYYLKTKNPGDIVKLTAGKSTYQLKLASNPENESKAYLGAYLEQNTKINEEFSGKYGQFIPKAIIWFYGLIGILFALNLGIGLFNLLPLGPLDGGRMAQLVLHKFFGEEKGNKLLGYLGMFFLIIILINLFAGFFK